MSFIKKHGIKVTIVVLLFAVGILSASVYSASLPFELEIIKGSFVIQEELKTNEAQPIFAQETYSFMDDGTYHRYEDQKLLEMGTYINLGDNIFELDCPEVEKHQILILDDVVYGLDLDGKIGIYKRINDTPIVS